jgi:hypothetical protein
MPSQKAEPQAVALQGLSDRLRRPAGGDPAVIEGPGRLPGSSPGHLIARRPVVDIQAQPLRAGHAATPARLSAWARSPSTTSS